jgi:CheY-like chemotaxis protein
MGFGVDATPTKMEIVEITSPVSSPHSSPISLRPVCHPTPRWRILHADDNALLGEVVVALFGRRGHFVEHVVDGVSAWNRWTQAFPPFDLLVTDHEMPALCGVELVQRLRTAGFGGRVVVYSSHLTEVETRQYANMGVDAIVPKSAKADELVSAVEAPVSRDASPSRSTGKALPDSFNSVSAAARR